jgi:hypothetical protein
MKMTLDLDLAMEAKALVALAFCNGSIENLHAGMPLYRLLWQRDYDPAAYTKTCRWDDATPRIGMPLNSRSP